MRDHNDENSKHYIFILMNRVKCCVFTSLLWLELGNYHFPIQNIIKFKNPNNYNALKGVNIIFRHIYDIDPKKSLVLRSFDIKLKFIKMS